MHRRELEVRLPWKDFCPENFGVRAASTNLYFGKKNFRIFVMRKFRLAESHIEVRNAKNFSCPSTSTNMQCLNCRGQKVSIDSGYLRKRTSCLLRPPNCEYYADKSNAQKSKLCAFSVRVVQRAFPFRLYQDALRWNH